MAKNKKELYKTPIASNMTVREASAYWDSHSFFEFDDVQEVNFDVELEGEKHYVLLDKDVAKKVEILSHKKKEPQHILVNELLKQSLRKVA